MPGGRDPENDAVDKAINDGRQSGHDAGQADKDVDRMGDDMSDDDQDSSDKARNTEGDGTDAARSAASALDDLGIPGTHGLTDKVRDLAGGLDKLADNLLGQRLHGDVLPIVKYQVFIGNKKPGGVLGMLPMDDLEEDLGDAADGLAGKAFGNSGVGKFLGGNLASTALGKAEDALGLKPKDDAQSTWTVYEVHYQETLSQPFRLELTLVRAEKRPPPAPAAPSGPAGLISQVKGAIAGALADPMGTAKSLISSAMSSDDSADEEPVMNAALDPKNFLNKPCGLNISRSETGEKPVVQRWVNGIISEFQDFGQLHDVPPDPAAGHTTSIPINPVGIMGALAGGALTPQVGGAMVYVRTIKITIVPSLAKLALRRSCRVFKDMTALEIIRAMLKEAQVYALATAKIPGMSSLASAGIPVLSNVAGDLAEHLKLVPRTGRDESNWTPKREMCVQYNETDLDFFHRLLEEEGISYFIEQKPHQERLVLVDNPFELHHCQTVDGKALPYSRPGSGPPKHEDVWSLRLRQNMRSNKVTLRDYNYSVPDQDHPTEVSSDSGWTGARNAESFELYQYPAPVTFQYDKTDKTLYRPYGDTMDPPVATLRTDALRSHVEFADGFCNVVNLAPGTTIKLKGFQHYRTAADPHSDVDKTKNLLILGVEHWGSDGTAVPPNMYLPPTVPTVPQALASARSGDDYRAVFSCLYFDSDDIKKHPYRPAVKTPRPVITGLQTATVVDPEHRSFESVKNWVARDASNRVYVRFHWDRKGADDPVVNAGSTCPVRVAQSMGGAGFGTMFTPRIGTEVLVSFLDGNPDRPLIVGSVYNGHRQLPPDYSRQKVRDMPDPPAPKKDKTFNQNGITTRSNPDEKQDRFNELVFDDTCNDEIIHLRAQQDLEEEVLNEHATTVVRDQRNFIENNQEELVIGRQRLEVGKDDPGGDRTKTVEGIETVTIAQNRDEKIMGDEKLTLNGSRDEQVFGVEDVEIGDPSAPLADTEITQQLTINGQRLETVLAFDNDKMTPPKDDKGNDILHVTKDKTDTITGLLHIVSGGFGLAVPGEAGSTEENKVDVTDKNIHIRSDKDVNLRAYGDIEIVSANNDIAFVGSTVDGQSKVTFVCEGQGITVAAAEEALVFTGKKIELTVAGASLVLEDGQDIVFTVKGLPPSIVRLSKADSQQMGFSLQGGTLWVTVDSSVKIEGGVTMVG